MNIEEKLVNPKKTIEVLQKYDFKFAKKFGQNFLIDPHVLDKIISCAEITKEDCVLEIGPGIGTLTQFLAEAAGSVVAVEIDNKLIPILEDTLSSYDNVTVINEDVMKVDIDRLVQEHNGGKPIKVVANLPYYITTPIIMSLLEKHVPIASITVMVQREVALRMQAGPGTKDYGALSLAVQYYSAPYLAANVPQNCFMPRPNVDSAVIHLQCYEKPPIEVEDEHLMFKLIRASFAQRRKTLVNGVANSAELSFTKEQVTQALRELSIKEDVRGETLNLTDFARLSDVLGRLTEGALEK
jgi:16S rRNA (adenine1518-N6/adenine1519-N6)-dimethyltransferase